VGSYVPRMVLGYAQCVRTWGWGPWDWRCGRPSGHDGQCGPPTDDDPTQRAKKEDNNV
jgi:hypothetical protein